MTTGGATTMKSAGRGLALRAVKGVSELADTLHRPPRGVVVLIYHRVGRRTGGEVDLPTELFDRQMELLGEQGRATTLDAALDALSGPEPPASTGPDPVVVTFDDGTVDFADVVVPILERHRIPATLYVATDYIETGRPFASGGLPLSWSALRDAVSTGLVTVGSHTHNHVLLDRADPAVADEELATSGALIEDRIGVPADHFAYPKALPGSPEVEALVRARFRSAAVAGSAPNPYRRSDPHRLRRSPIQVADGIRWFLKKANGGMALEDVLRRRLLNPRRYAGAVT